ncbi:MAG: chemotaxis protein CheD [Oscillospiraceae bacterium]|nr:chemotaxis protein CheD [Oscillospiraceae bacterium]
MGSVTIGISDMKVVRDGDSIITYALGSCVGVAMYDSAKKIAGLAHILMPSSKDVRDANINPMKYVDLAVPELAKRMRRAGASEFNIVAKIAGGAQMFAMSGASAQFNIGDRNINMARESLKKLGIRIAAQDVGANYGRTVEIFSDTGIYRVKAIAKGIIEI